MNLKKIAVKTTLAGAMGAAAVGLGAGMAHAEPFLPPPWPVPAPPAEPGIGVQGPDVTTPGLNFAAPGASIDGPSVSAPGLGIQGPDASIGGPSVSVPPVGIEGPGVGIAPPAWAPPQPLPPPWAPFAPVSWNAEANAWGVYTNAGFQPV